MKKKKFEGRTHGVIAHLGCTTILRPSGRCSSIRPSTPFEEKRSEKQKKKMENLYENLFPCSEINGYISAVTSPTAATTPGIINS
jgi:hypothetical protein